MSQEFESYVDDLLRKCAGFGDTKAIRILEERSLEPHTDSSGMQPQAAKPEAPAGGHSGLGA